MKGRAARWMAVAIVLPALASAESEGQDPSSQKAPKRQVVRFDDDTISGDLMRPDGDLVSARPELELPSLIEPPRSFARDSRRIRLAAAAALGERADEAATGSRQRRMEGGDGAQGADPPSGVR